MSGTPAWAAGKPHVLLHLSSALLVHSGKKVRYVAIDRPLHAGEVIRYTIEARNAGTAPALDFAAVGRVPADSVYRAGSAASPEPVKLEYSLDGSAFSPRPMRLVQTPKGPQRRPAPPSSYVAVRFLSTKPIPPKAAFHYAYEVTVR